MTFALDRAKAPCTVNSFTYLAGKKYFDNTPCHRLTTAANFGVLQCGDPGGSGSGGPGYSFADELDKNGKYTKGVLAMANSGPNTNGSQFFIVYKDTQLAPNYTIFGTVTKGLDVVEKVAKGGTQSGEDGKPKTAISLKTVTLAELARRATPGRSGRARRRPGSDRPAVVDRAAGDHVLGVDPAVGDRRVQLLEVAVAELQRGHQQRAVLDRAVQRHPAGGRERHLQRVPAALDHHVPALLGEPLLDPHRGVGRAYRGRASPGTGPGSPTRR